MSHYTRPDNTPSTPPTRQRPIVLARLPRIGASSPAVTTAVRSTPAPEPAPAVPPPEQMPRLELRTQLNERIKLHVAERPDDQQSAKTVYYAEREHVRTPADTTGDNPPEPSVRHQRTRSHRRANDSRPVTLGEKLFQLHNHLSPHAGLIVALALVASAGLLYWLIVGPAQLPAPQYDNIGNEIQIEGLGESAHQMPENYVPQFAAEAPQSDVTQQSEDQWNEITLPTPPASAEPNQLPPLEQDSLKPESNDTADASPYPKSLASQPLDFSKVTTPAANPQSADQVWMLPEVARRPSPSTNR